MTHLLLIAAGMMASTDAAAPTVAESVTQTVAGEAQTGTLIFSEGDCLCVQIFTGSPLTHVAAVVVEDGEPIVYDSMNGSGVRRQSLASYLESQQPGELRLMHPVEPFSEAQAAQFAEHLGSQRGRPYSVKHHLTGKRVKGVHCSELITEALMASQLMHANNPARVTPASLAKGALDAGLYAEGGAFLLTESEGEAAEGRGWCRRMWSETKQCTLASCSQMQRWVLCW